MTRLMLVALFLFFAPSTFGEVSITEKLVLDITRQFEKAIEQRDISVFRKYINDQTTIIVDMDPALNEGETEIDAATFFELARMSMKLMDKTEIHNEILEIKIDKKSNTGVIEEKTTATMDMMGTTIEDISISKTKFGVVNGKVVILHMQDHVVSTTSK